jgi:hypothetical protein
MNQPFLSKGSYIWKGEVPEPMYHHLILTSKSPTQVSPMSLGRKAGYCR